jgi:NADPH-dependent glutamate synthase beta subunit-like oxidoreductase/NAD(P)H-flavin reductase
MIRTERSKTGRKGDFELGISGFNYSDLYDSEGLRRLTETFYHWLKEENLTLAQEFEALRNNNSNRLNKIQESNLLIQVAPYQSRFIAKLFRIEKEWEHLLKEHQKHDPIFEFKREVVVRLSKKYRTQAASLNPEDPFQWVPKLRPDLHASMSQDPEMALSTLASELLELNKAYEEHFKQKEPVPLSDKTRQKVKEMRKALQVSEESDDVKNYEFLKDLLDQLAQWAAKAIHEKEEHGKYPDWVSLHLPETMDLPDGLVKVKKPDLKFPNLMETPGDLRLREGFKLTDPRGSLKSILDQANYCVICHEREKDSCTKGLPLPRKDQPVQKNVLGVTLAGCPLDERISEMHYLKRQGDTIASLAMVMIDNPMCPTTGHRICNDCMKACIYQKQEPVNIPQIETRSLTDVLNLPYGVEIYGLLTRWNPINVKRPYMLPYNGINVLVVGLGPAGFALSQYLTNEGFGVVGIDGLKIEPITSEWIGNEESLPKPVKSFTEIYDELDQRVSSGFGGVAEYGITVRWDKNFLKLIYLTLLRKEQFKVYGGIRFGGTLPIDDVWNLGFHHIAIAAGAGKPSIVEMKNNLIPGIRKASDFLMALQLTGAYKKFSAANLLVRLPVVVIGGGLTGIDTATESLAYYPLQVEKMLDRFEILVKEFGEEQVWKPFFDWEKEILKEMLEHGKAIREERSKAQKENRKPEFAALCQKWGGVKLVYRKEMQDAPAYRLNHEEIIKGLEEGIHYVDALDPREAVPDENGWVKEVKFEKMKEVSPGKWEPSGEIVSFPARTVLVAAGTSPNIIYEREHAGTFKLDARKRFFLGHKVVEGKLVEAPQVLAEHGFFTSYQKDGKFISYYGDNHPVYAGSVVKAVASGKYGSQAVTQLFGKEISNLNPSDQQKRDEAWKKFREHLDDQLKVRVHEVKRLTPTITEVVLKAPQQARQFNPGQFYRLQNYETKSVFIEGTKLQMEGIALTGAWVDKKAGLLSLIALELGVSSRLCAFLKKGDEVVAMGPTGTPSEIGKNENVLLCGGGLGNAVLFSIAKAAKEAGNKVLYFAGYKKPEDLFHRDDIEAACDQVIWSVDAGEPIKPRRPQDRSFVGNIVQSMLTYAKGELGDRVFPLEKAHRMLAIGSDRMMAAVKQSRFTVLKEYFDHPHEAIASINSPMQCMMKEVCAQCLQRHIDPGTGKETYIFSCFNQDQKMDFVDWKYLNDRLRQNTVQEKLSNLWLDYILKKHPMEHV